jgi:hypothetical protein
MGFGRYQFWIEGRVDRLDPNVVLGLLNYPTPDVGPDATNEIDIDIPSSKKSSYVPATVSVTLKRGQEILAGDWYACYESIKRGEPCN